ncbi:MAG: biotin--[acetyl-CoA-carboxylase] ligase [Thermoguttaceae bacterium]
MFDVDCVLQQTFVARVEHYPSIGSTNDRAIECADGPGEELPLLVVADCQTAGRGRGSHRWWTGRGSLAMSLLFEAEVFGPTRPSAPPMAALAVAVALVETLTGRLPCHKPGIHWPNDIMVGDRKLAGILVEVLPNRRHVVGVGLNTNNSSADAPAELKQTVATLKELTGKEHDHTELLVELLGHMDRVFSQLASAPHRIGARADALCLQRGQTLSVTLGSGSTQGRSTRGRCAGIAPDGALLLDTPDGRKSFYTGELRP